MYGPIYYNTEPDSKTKKSYTRPIFVVPQNLSCKWLAFLYQL